MPDAALEHATMLRQLAEARRLLPFLAERGDDFLYSEFASVLEDGPLDDEGNDIIGREVDRLIEAEALALSMDSETR